MERKKIKKINGEFSLLLSIVIPIAINYLQILRVQNIFLEGTTSKIKRDTEAAKNSETLTPESLNKIKRQSEADRLVFNRMYLVFVLSTFDAFLSDVTKFLLLSNREKISTDIQIPLAELLTPSAIARAINTKIEKKCRDTAARSFIERLNFLRRTFDVEIQASEEDIAFIRTISGKRNELVHAHDVFSLHLDRNFRISTKGKDDIKITIDELNNATRTTARLMLQIIESIADKYKPNVDIKVGKAL